MNPNNNPIRKMATVLCGGALVLAAGCVIVKEGPTRTVYVPAPPPIAGPVVEAPPPAAQPAPVVVVVAPDPAPAPIVHAAPAPVYTAPPVIIETSPIEPQIIVIHRNDDFFEPLTPYGEWIHVTAHGRVWRPVRVGREWRPYADGYWQRTDLGWYWVSDEPWAWATYHYGRWDLTPEYGWIWVPQREWAPAWVAWREGNGYVGWAPLPPSARVSASGYIEIHEAALAPRFVFVEERRVVERVRPTTVIVNNTTIINQTVNVTRVKVENKKVINEGPRVEVIERTVGRKIQATASSDLRRRHETEASEQRKLRKEVVAKPAAKSEPARRTPTPPISAPGAVRSNEKPRGNPTPPRAEIEQQKPARPMPAQIPPKRIATVPSPRAVSIAEPARTIEPRQTVREAKTAVETARPKAPGAVQGKTTTATGPDKEAAKDALATNAEKSTVAEPVRKEVDKAKEKPAEKTAKAGHQQSLLKAIFGKQRSDNQKAARQSETNRPPQSVQAANPRQITR